MNIFQQFQGADLTRLIQCINKIKQEGLTLNEHCQAGVNKNSGNVYIYSEDWAGCVYTSIGFDTQWNYACPECGEEHDFNTENACQQYAKLYNHKCEFCNPNQDD